MELKLKSKQQLPKSLKNVRKLQIPSPQKAAKPKATDSRGLSNKNHLSFAQT